MPRIENTWFWVGLALLLKTMVMLFLIYNLHLLNGDGLIGICSGDCPDYLHTAQNVAKYFTFGRMYEGELSPYAGRMPGYDIVLAPLSLFFDETTVQNLTVLLQILLSALSTYFLAKIAYHIFPTKKIFYLTFFIYGLNTFVSFYDLCILTESFFVSAFIIGFYFFITAKNLWGYLLAGAFLTWAILMRPYILPIWALLNLYLIYLFFTKRFASFSSLIKIGLSFNLVFGMTEALWIMRNYMQFNKFIPVVTDVHAGLKEGKFLALMEFVQSWGGDMVSWNPDSEMVLFYKMPQINHLPNKYQSFADLPEYVFTSAYNADSLEKIKKIYAITEDTTYSGTERMEADRQVTALLRKYRKSFIEEKPFYFYVVAPLRLLPKFLFHSGSYYLSDLPFAKQNFLQKMVKIAYSGLYYFTLLIGLAFIVYAVANVKQLPVSQWLILLIPLYIIILCPLVLRRIEYRYFILAYPFLSILACYMLNLLLSYVNKPKFQKT
jgi:hypothetical protein